TVFWPLQALMAAPSILFLATLAVMLFRPPDLQFYWADRIAFALLVFVVVLRTLLLRRRLNISNPAMWPMAALIVIGLASLLLQAVANGVTLNLLGLVALDSFRRGRLKGVFARLLVIALPLAILATQTRAVWLSFAGCLALLVFLSSSKRVRRTCLLLILAGGA